MGKPSRDSGVTLIELLVTISLLGAMMAIAFSGWASWAHAGEQSGTARELQSLLRQTQQRAVTEGRAMCVQFDVPGDQYSVYRGACSDAGRTIVRGPIPTGSARVHLASPAFVEAGTETGVTFFARGTATPGSVEVTRTGSSTVFTLAVERLTGRVSLT